MQAGFKLFGPTRVRRNRTPPLVRAYTTTALLLLVVVAPLGCGETSHQDTTLVWQPLIAPDSWVSSEATSDPLIEHRPESVVCIVRPWQQEGNGIELDTTECNYISITQPLLHSVDKGASLYITLWWNFLINIEPAEGHIALLVRDEIVWEERVDIPNPPDLREVLLTAPFDMQKNDNVTLHLHNHGSNTWRFERFDLGVPQ